MLLKQIQCFVAVVETGGFTRAAKQLYITQSAVSQQIAALETELGTELFYRRGHLIELTDSGRYFYRETKPLLERLANTVDKVADIPNSRERHLSVYYRGDAVDKLVVPILAELRRRCPDMRLSLLRSKRTGDTLASVNAGEADIAILKKGPHPLTSAMKFCPLNCFTHLSCVLPSGHRLAEKPCIVEDDLAGEHLVLLENRPSSSPNQVLRNDLRYQWIHERLKGRFPDAYTPAPDSIVAVTMAKAGFGITLVDSSQVPDGSGLAFAPFAENRLFEYGAFYHRHNVNPLVGEFVAVVRKIYRVPRMFGPASRLQPLEEFLVEHPGMQAERDEDEQVEETANRK